MIRRLPLVLVFTVLAGCQGYNYRSVPAQTYQVDNQYVLVPAPPDLMIVQDTSGSMCEAITQLGSNGQSCVGNDGYCSSCSPGNGTCTPGCATKMQLTASTLATIIGGLNPTPGEFSLGLAAFPDDTADSATLGAECGTGVVVVPVADAYGTAPLIESFYGEIAASPFGGTPTAATLLGPVAADAAFKDQTSPGRKFVLLVTDGLPNCDSDNACGTMPWSNGGVYGCESPTFLAAHGGVNAAPNSACSCSFGDCSDVSVTASCCTGTDPNECLDGSAAVAAVTSLNQNGIDTIVLGMGTDYTDGSVLDAMMAAGGSGLNSGNHYQANNSTTLTADLQTLITSLIGRCDYTVDSTDDAAVDPRLIGVSLNGQPLVAGDPNGYTFTAPNLIDISGSACATIKTSGSTAKVQITAVAP